MKVKAVNEMMERIKLGVVLRPVKGQESKVTSAVIPASFQRILGVDLPSLVWCILGNRLLSPLCVRCCRESQRK